MTRRLAIALLGSALLAAGIPASSAAAANKCKVKNSTTLANNTFLRVYGKDGTAIACVKKSGRKRTLGGAVPGTDLFRVGGKWVVWTKTGSAPQSVVDKKYVPDGRRHDDNFPFDTNGHVEGIVIKSDGAAAWVFSSSGASTIVQGQDRKNHPPDQLSDDTKDAVGSSLKSGPGSQIHWNYSDGSSGSANLY
jgi:hypothetical protein